MSKSTRVFKKSKTPGRSL
uniref:Uncharacterized protein n=1 Tax=Arundo donax TaxID=35708 RepID=A0A0A9BFT1_ARUDO